MAKSKPNIDAFTAAVAAALNSGLPNKVGACIEIGDSYIIGCNTRASDFSVKPCPDEIHLHAEFNTLMFAFEEDNYQPDIIYVTEFPCIECAKLIVAVGFTTVVSPQPGFSKWFESQQLAMKLFDAFNVEVFDAADLVLPTERDWPEEIEEAMLNMLDRPEKH